MTSDVTLRRGRRYQVELDGRVVERFRSQRNTDLAIKGRTEMTAIDVVEIPNDMNDPNALPYEPVKGMIRDQQGARFDGFDAMFGEEIGPTRGLYSITYPSAVCLMALGEDVIELS